MKNKLEPNFPVFYMLPDTKTHISPLGAFRRTAKKGVNAFNLWLKPDLFLRHKKKDRTGSPLLREQLWGRYKTREKAEVARILKQILERQTIENIK